MIDAIKKYAGVDLDQVPDDAAAKKLADEHHIEYEERHKKEMCIRDRASVPPLEGQEMEPYC